MRHWLVQKGISSVLWLSDVRLSEAAIFWRNWLFLDIFRPKKVESIWTQGFWQRMSSKVISSRDGSAGENRTKISIHSPENRPPRAILLISSSQMLQIYNIFNVLNFSVLKSQMLGFSSTASHRQNRHGFEGYGIRDTNHPLSTHSKLHGQFRRACLITWQLELQEAKILIFFRSCNAFHDFNSSPKVFFLACNVILGHV